MKKIFLFVAFLFALTVHGQNAEHPLYQSYDVTEDSVFLPWAEGPDVDLDGVLYAVNYKESGTIGYVRPDGSHGLFVDLPEGSTGNGIRIWKNKSLFIADYTGHNILKVNLDDHSVKVWAHSDSLSQPNDIAITTGGRVYASDPDWEKGTGSIWMASRQGNMKKVADDMGTTNGIEVSPDEKHLYVNESNHRNVWVFDILEDGELTNKRSLIRFDDFGMDGMRCDEKGNIYITRMNKGTVVMLSPGGEILREIDLKGKKPTNVAFGGKDGRTIYVTVADRGAIEAFRTEYVGRSFQMKEMWEKGDK